MMAVQTISQIQDGEGCEHTEGTIQAARRVIDIDSVVQDIDQICSRDEDEVLEGLVDDGIEQVRAETSLESARSQRGRQTVLPDSGVGRAELEAFDGSKDCDSQVEDHRHGLR